MEIFNKIKKTLTILLATLQIASFGAKVHADSYLDEAKVKDPQNNTSINLEIEINNTIKSKFTNEEVLKHANNSMDELRKEYSDEDILKAYKDVVKDIQFSNPSLKEDKVKKELKAIGANGLFKNGNTIFVDGISNGVIDEINREAVFAHEIGHAIHKGAREGTSANFDGLNIDKFIGPFEEAVVSKAQNSVLLEGKTYKNNGVISPTKADESREYLDADISINMPTSRTYATYKTLYSQFEILTGDSNLLKEAMLKRSPEAWKKVRDKIDGKYGQGKFAELASKTIDVFSFIEYPNKVLKQKEIKSKINTLYDRKNVLTGYLNTMQGPNWLSEVEKLRLEEDKEVEKFKQFKENVNEDNMNKVKYIMRQEYTNCTLKYVEIDQDEEIKPQTKDLMKHRILAFKEKLDNFDEDVYKKYVEQQLQVHVDKAANYYMLSTNTEKQKETIKDEQERVEKEIKLYSEKDYNKTMLDVCNFSIEQLENERKQLKNSTLEDRTEIGKFGQKLLEFQNTCLTGECDENGKINNVKFNEMKNKYIEENLSEIVQLSMDNINMKLIDTTLSIPSVDYKKPITFCGAINGGNYDYTIINNDKYYSVKFDKNIRYNNDSDYTIDYDIEEVSELKNVNTSSIKNMKLDRPLVDCSKVSKISKNTLSKGSNCYNKDKNFVNTKDGR